MHGVPELLLAACLSRLAGRIFMLAIVLYVLDLAGAPVPGVLEARLKAIAIRIHAPAKSRAGMRQVPPGSGRRRAATDP